MVILIYAVLVYSLFLFTFLYAIGFIAGMGVPLALRSPAFTPPLEALLCDLVLLGIFAAQHSVMARRGFKAWWTKIVPPAAERSTYVFAASAALYVLCRYWQPIDGTVWSVTHPTAVTILQVLFWLGWGVLLLATFLINHFELFGLRQAWAHMRGVPVPHTEFHTPGLYRYVRHPIYLGFLMAFWATPEMTLGHLLFAAGSTGYILVGIWFEERDLVAHFGERYRSYKAQVGMLFPRLSRRSGSGPAKQG